MEEINNRIMFFINKYNLNRFLIVLIIILISFSVVHSQPNNYESELIRQEYNLDREIQFFKLEFNLNDDGSVDALLEIRFINPIEIEKDEYVIIEDKLQINDEEQIEEDSFIITDIYRQDLVYTLTDDFDPTDCVGKYFFNPLNNDL